MEQKRILLIDLDDSRRASRVNLLNSAGYQVEVRADFQAAVKADDESEFDLVILALHVGSEEASAYSNRLAVANKGLPILLLTDVGVFVPAEAFSRSTEAGYPAALMTEVASMLTTSLYIRKVPVGD